MHSCPSFLPSPSLPFSISLGVRRVIQRHLLDRTCSSLMLSRAAGLLFIRKSLRNSGFCVWFPERTANCVRFCLHTLKAINRIRMNVNCKSFDIPFDLVCVCYVQIGCKWCCLSGGSERKFSIWNQTFLSKNNFVDRFTCRLFGLIVDSFLNLDKKGSCALDRWWTKRTRLAFCFFAATANFRYSQFPHLHETRRQLPCIWPVYTFMHILHPSSRPPPFTLRAFAIFSITQTLSSKYFHSLLSLFCRRYLAKHLFGTSVSRQQPFASAYARAQICILRMRILCVTRVCVHKHALYKHAIKLFQRRMVNVLLKNRFPLSPDLCASRPWGDKYRQTKWSATTVEKRSFDTFVEFSPSLENVLLLIE